MYQTRRRKNSLPRDEQILIKLSHQEKTLLKLYAEHSGKSLSKFLVDCAMKVGYESDIFSRSNISKREADEIQML